MAELWAIMAVSLISIVGGLGAVFFKKGAEKFSLSVSGVFKNKNLLMGVIIYAIALFVFTFSLRGGELTIIYPLVSTSYVWAAIFSVKFLGESMTRYKLLGIVLIIIGVSAVGIG